MPTPQTSEWHLPRSARSPGRARTLLRAQTSSWKLREEVAETATLLLSELVTNAYRHGKAPAGREIWVRCYVTPARLRVEVLDANATLPAPLPALPEAEAGRGLLLVAALADAWGAEGRACGVGKTVWFELALT